MPPIVQMRYRFLIGNVKGKNLIRVHLAYYGKMDVK
jgi:hypothetical protein